MATEPAPGDTLSPTEAFVEAQIERSLAPYRGKFPPELIEEFAEELRVFLYTHPVASTLLARARPHDEQNSGGEARAGMTLDAQSTVRKGQVG